MSTRVIRKALGLLVVDIVLIIGIFVLQFRTDSTIIEKIGNLQVTLALTEDQNSTSLLKNKLQVSYNGINFYCDDQHPALISASNSSEKTALVLQSWKKDDLSLSFKFSKDVTLIFTLSSEAPDATLSTQIILPSGVSNFYLPYSFNYNMKIQKEEGSHILVDGKRSTWELSASNLSKDYLAFSHENTLSSYAVYDNSHQFSFEVLGELALSSLSNYNNTISVFKNNLINSFKANTVEANLTEQAVVSYVAAQAEKGNYVQTLEDIPQSFKKSKNRTYLSAPYFNTLADMNTILDKTLLDNEQLITRSVNTSSLDIYTVRNLAEFLFIHPDRNNVITLLQRAANADISKASLAQVTGILQVYTSLSEYDSSLASILLPVLEECVNKIEASCTYDGVVLTISENDTFLSVVQAIETGVTLLRYGSAIGNQIYVKAGYAIVNSYISENSSFDLRTLSNLYPILAYDNFYYPHFVKIEADANSKIWAWTCAKKITLDDSEEKSLSFNIDFPENYTHYIIFKGMPAFKTIYIYNMAFRTDPRFETYNSSGYVYLPETKTLLLKSRHKSKIENIRMDLYGNEGRPASSSSTSAAASSSSSGSTNAGSTSAGSVSTGTASSTSSTTSSAGETSSASAETSASESNTENQNESTEASETSDVSDNTESSSEETTAESAAVEETPPSPPAETPASNGKKKKNKNN